MEFITLSKQENLIADIILYPLKVNRDKRGILVEILKPIGPRFLVGCGH